MTKSRVLSGVQPTGKLHIGNYLGALKNFVELQDSGDYECFFMIADYHSITENYSPAEKPREVLELAADFLALGIDPSKSVIFVQSELPEHTELAWIFSTLTPIAFLERMTQFKDKAKLQKTNINAGLFNYPVLQAADVLLYKPTAVPVGEDQLQHLELTNDIARKFNFKYGKTFDLVKPLLTKAPRVTSLLEPRKKMSKSDPKGCLFLTDDVKTIEKKLARAVTDTGKEQIMGEGVKNLFTLLQIFGEPDQYEFYLEAHKSGNVRYADLKTNLAKVIAHHFAEYRENHVKLEKNPNYIRENLLQGNGKAKAIASQTLSEVKQKIGLVV